MTDRTGTHAGLSDRVAEFERTIAFIRQPGVREALSGISKGGGLAVAAEERLNALVAGTGLRSVKAPRDAQHFCWDLIFIHYTDERGWEWGPCAQSRE